jgi:hypothetical protein
MRSGAAKALGLLGPASQFRPTATVLLGLAEQIGQRDDVADGLFAEARGSGAGVRRAGGPGRWHWPRALIAVRHHRWVDAEVLADRSLATVERGHLEDYPTSALSFAASGPRGHAPG